MKHLKKDLEQFKLFFCDIDGLFNINGGRVGFFLLEVGLKLLLELILLIVLLLNLIFGNLHFYILTYLSFYLFLLFLYYLMLLFFSSFDDLSLYDMFLNKVTIKFTIFPFS